MSEIKKKTNKKVLDYLKDNKGFSKFVVIVLSIGLALIVILSSFSSNNSTEDLSQDVQIYVDNLEKKLTKTLKKVDGVGDVSVVINVESGKETVLASKITTKVENGVKEIEESPVIVNGKTIVLKEKYPEIIGVLIVAEGCDNISVRYKIEKATCSLLKVESNKIEILSMK